MHHNDKESENILSTWLVLEALIPQLVKLPDTEQSSDNDKVFYFSGNPEPWLRQDPQQLNPETLDADVIQEDASVVNHQGAAKEKQDKQQNNKAKKPDKIYYKINLGLIKLNIVHKHLVTQFGDEKEESHPISGKSALASILLDEKGVLSISSHLRDVVSISRFGFSFPLILEKKFKDLLEWNAVEQETSQKIAEILNCKDQNGDTVPVDQKAILKAYNYLVETFNLPKDCLEAPNLCIKITRKADIEKKPSISLINSFLISDINKAKSLAIKNQLPKSLGQYLGQNHGDGAIDLLANNRVMEEVLAPVMMPLVRWPAPGGYPLVLLQQAAVNLSQKIIANGGLLSVNGPPGTGKTTLLRDVIASVILNRATEMAKFEDPCQAFQPIECDSSAIQKLFLLDKSLKGHEIFVVSSNNKAVENISHELPAKTAIDPWLGELNYFKSISDNLFKQMTTGQDNDNAANGDQSGSENFETWGLIAAALGKFSNKENFVDKLWYDKNYAIKDYLLAAKGIINQIDKADKATGQIIKQDPEVIAAEKPKHIGYEAINEWNLQRDKFRTLKTALETEIGEFEAIRLEIVAQDEQNTILVQTQLAKNADIATLKQLQEKADNLTNQLAGLDIEIAQNDLDLSQKKSTKPHILSRYLNKDKWQIWAQRDRELNAISYNLRGKKLILEQDFLRQKIEKQKLEKQIAAHNEKILHYNENFAQTNAKIAAKKRELGCQFIDEAFFTQDHAAINLASPWLPNTLHKKRELLFAAAMDLHRAFINAAADKIIVNLENMMTILKTSDTCLNKKPELLSDLWSSLFMVVPVLSSTFSSIAHMMRNLPPQSIGWLLIDEAGQATPQAAVGAIMRSKRVIAVGDPLQIPPVSTLPLPIVKEICKLFKVDPNRWVAPMASVQTLVDSVSPYQTSFSEEKDKERVGIPLLVHRRCQDPMFSISNKIAYNNKMVHAVLPSKNNEISNILGPSGWFDIVGAADSKWCLDEGEFMVKILDTLINAGQSNPDIFIITPFRIIADELKSRFKNDKDLQKRLKIENTKWIEDRIGTVHTFQGHEADTVFIVLGAPNDTQQGARNWAAETPNIFNVAVSRAKKNAYIIGSHKAWAETGFVRDVASLMEVRKLN